MADRKEIRERVGSLGMDGYDLGGPIDTAIENIQRLKEMAEERGYRDICLEDVTEWDGCNFALEVWGTRDETDKEMEKRLKKAAQDKARAKEKKEKAKEARRKEYEKLKKEFESE